MIRETTEKIVQIKNRLLTARSCQKSYADVRRRPLEFNMGDKVMLKVSPWKGMNCFGKRGKLSPRYIRPFKVLERVGPVAYKRHFKSLSLDELRSPDFNLFSDQEYSEEEEAEAMAETIEQYMSKTQTDYGSGVARPKIEEEDSFELKGQFLKELREIGLAILEARGAIPTKTVAYAKKAIQEMAEYSQKWHNGTSRGRRCEQCKGPHYTKDRPLKEEGKTLEEAYYTQFDVPFQGGGYRATAPGFYQRNNANPSYQERRKSMEDTLSKFMGESGKRHEENFNLIKEIRASTDAAIRNQGASIKTLEIQIRQMSKVLQESGFASLPSSTETNPRDQVKSISTNIEADSHLIRLIMEYLVNISKRHAFWSLNEDILKITILKTNTPYPSMKIGRIRVCTHQRPQRNKAQYAVSRRFQYALSKLEEDGTTTPFPITKSSSLSPPNAPSKTPSTKDTSSTFGTTSSSFESKPLSSPPSSNNTPSPQPSNPFLDDIMDAPPRPSNPVPLQSHPLLDITLSLSPITPLDHILDTPSPPSPPPLNHLSWAILFTSTFMTIMGQIVFIAFTTKTFFSLRDEMNFMFAHLEYLLTSSIASPSPPQP
ncbi:hypothetical protein Tco_0795544 [Tanacetum coccineum]